MASRNPRVGVDYQPVEWEAWDRIVRKVRPRKAQDLTLTIVRGRQQCDVTIYRIIKHRYGEGLTTFYCEGRDGGVFIGTMSLDFCRFRRA